MRKTLYLKFILTYAVFGLLGFIAISTIGSRLVQFHLEKRISEQIYREANAISVDNTVRYRAASYNLGNIYNNLSALAVYQNAQIWVMNQRGEVLLDTNQGKPYETPLVLESFDPLTWGSSYYQTGNFFGYFQEPMISVIAPITSDMTIKGYVAIHYPMNRLYQEREQILAIIHVVFFLLFVLSLLMLLLFTCSVYRPLRKITIGAEEYSAGHLDYEIPVHSQDEMGYLAKTLNYMSGELNNSGEYQRKFIANISHDFRSPLTSIKGYLEAIADGTIGPDNQEKYIQIVLNETNRLEKLTESLLTLNNLDVKSRLMHLRAFDINKVIKNTAATFEGTCRNKKISIELILSGAQLYAYADMEQIQQVLYNLLDNAIKFSPNESVITIETTEKNERILVSVKDRGAGVSKENLPKIWDRFFKEDSSRGKDRKGTGLGLSIVKEIINAHKQNIDVISTEGVGTEFIFSLDRVQDSREL
ncbi:MAG: HAMP domain-containing protein [Lachnospiraceae bacterium]|nr:HAMP domain-containing protein [Lachnospiraceae bacterium]